MNTMKREEGSWELRGHSCRKKEAAFQSECISEAEGDLNHQGQTAGCTRESSDEQPAQKALLKTPLLNLIGSLQQTPLGT